jgi:outer membrane protein assembly factor BamB
VLTMGRQVTAAVDLTTGATLWRNNAFRAAALLDEVVVGMSVPRSGSKSILTGLAVADGVKRWTGPALSTADVVPGGPSFAVMIAEETFGDRFYALVRADGTLSGRTKGIFGMGLRCRYDDVSLTVCATAGTDLLFALDATTGKDLWQLPAPGRTTPSVTAVWHGAVYGTASGAPVVLDARTGVDREPRPGLAPVAVTGHTGVAAETAGTAGLTAYPATG